MLRTVELDHQLRFVTKEVRDELPDWMLSAEFESDEPPGAQPRP
jgi:hypothetical protein